VDSLVSTEWLAGRLGQAGVVVADVRWYLDPTRSGREAYRQGHVPGAVFLDLDRDLAAPGGLGGGARGRHPWPGEEQVARVMGGAGIGPGVHVVCYDDAAGAVAARLWYVLRAHGHEAVSVLDGGIGKWVAQGRPLSTAEAPPAPAAFTGRLRPGWVVTKAELLAEPPRLLLDARAGERYRGEAEPVDPRAGHIPGARSAPYAGNLTAGPTPVFRSPEELRERYTALGADGAEPVVYCGSGVTACHDLLALDLAGLRGRLYAGSWSEWSADASLPVETGPGPPSRHAG
jgi:thiosulfate/3-mercaptopyruvate sulfurtransferase